MFGDVWNCVPRYLPCPVHLFTDILRHMHESGNFFSFTMWVYQLWSNLYFIGSNVNLSVLVEQISNKYIYVIQMWNMPCFNVGLLSLHVFLCDWKQSQCFASNAMINGLKWPYIFYSSDDVCNLQVLLMEGFKSKKTINIWHHQYEHSIWRFWFHFFYLPSVLLRSSTFPILFSFFFIVDSLLSPINL